MNTQLNTRGTLYALLALGFAYPESHEEIKLLRDSLYAANSLDPDERMTVALGGLDTAIQELATSALAPAEEHTYLFARQTPCPPYESAYVFGNHGNMLGDIAGFYRAFGVQVAQQAHEPVDHLSAQLEFMALLCAKEARARADKLTEQAEVCRDARRAFLSDHLGRWVLFFLARLDERARLALYPAFGRVLEQVVLSDSNGLGLSLESPEQVLVQRSEEEPIECPV